MDTFAKRVRILVRFTRRKYPQVTQGIDFDSEGIRIVLSENSLSEQVVRILVSKGAHKEDDYTVYFRR